MSKVNALKLTEVILVAGTNTQRIEFSDTKSGNNLIERLKESGWLPQFSATYAKASDLVAAGVYSQAQVDAFKLECQTARQQKLDELKAKAAESETQQTMYDCYKQMFANGTDKVPAFTSNAVILNDGNQRAHLLYDAEVLKQLALKEEAKKLGTNYKPEWVKTIPGEERTYANMWEWFFGQAGSNIVAESKVNLTITDRIKSGTEAFLLGATFDKVSSLMPAGDSRQRAPYAAYVNRLTDGLLLKRMMLDSTHDDYIAEGAIFASGLKDKMTSDDRIQIIVAKVDDSLRAYFKKNNEAEWNKAVKGETSKVPTTLVAIDNGTAKKWKKADVIAWLDSITKKGMTSRSSQPRDTATTEALAKQKNDAVTLATMTGSETAEELVRGAVGNDTERKEFSEKMAVLGPVLDVFTTMFKTDKENTIALADQLRGVDVSLLPNIVKAVKAVVTPAPQGGKRPAKKSK